MGLSPRGRGNLCHLCHFFGGYGSIPAWAGKPRSQPDARCARIRRVYPRVGGETDFDSSADLLVTGLSPRGRGNLAGSDPAGGDKGSIPAWAGKPMMLPYRWCWCRVYPRVGGETCCQRVERQRIGGLSPRGRGNPMNVAPSHHGVWSIPAWAGKPVDSNDVITGQMVYPRVGGETASPRPATPRLGGLSPRGRGNSDSR